MTPAQIVFESWLVHCRRSTDVDGDNVICVRGISYVIQYPPIHIANGGLRGHVWEHGPSGFKEIGVYHINRSGEVLRCPDKVRSALSRGQIIKPVLHLKPSFQKLKLRNTEGI